MKLDLDQPIHDQIDESREASDCAVPPDVRDYYDGDHPPVATPDQQQALGDRAIRPYVDNVLAQCTDTLAGRLLFRRYLVEDGDAEQDWCDAFAAKNHLSEKLVANTVRVLVDGNHAVSLSWDDEAARPLVHLEPWWDGEEGMYVEVADNGIEEWAVKEWQDRDKRKRRTVYLPDRILRYVQDAGAWQPYPDDETAEQPWVRNAEGAPLGVPVIHFGNVSTVGTAYGASVLFPILGLQDALNGTVFDIVAAQALNAFGIYTATGVDVNDTSLSVGPGRLWKAANDAAKFGILNGAEMTAILDGYRAIRGSIANAFPVSEHLISGGQWPSGMALQRADAPMIGRVKMLGETFAPGWVRLAHRAMELENAANPVANLDEDRMIVVEYEPAEQLDAGTVTEIDQARVAMYRDLADLPYELMVKSSIVTADEAERIVRERQETRSALMSAFNRGDYGTEDYQ